ncbi:hypothetical protein [Vibrio parahaemolyticus]|uniref:hypothetical protein n=1 Tax=Vibrio parahaemolyticus TaxID=670 RepID=UPI00111DAEB0|nr:hypothetical protein [Vibrio parahaemolyticus]TOP27213.1 hypothetical protein CGH19_22995 [Vibrio parahaemolyticus]
MSDIIDNELLRYVEYLQTQLVTEGSEPFLNGERDWFIKSRTTLQQALKDKVPENDLDGSHKKNALLSRLDNFEPATKYDSFFPSEIFSQVLEDVINIYANLGINLDVEVELYNSPSMTVGAHARPSLYGHAIFAGAGTTSFCNYWAKIYTTISLGAAQRGMSVFEEAAVNDIITDLNIAIDAFRLCVHYGYIGTVRGFGRLEQPQEMHADRAILVHSMEVFIVAHEFYHLYLEEKYPESNGIPPDHTEKDVEELCDAMALAVVTTYGIEKNNIYASHLLGPLLFFSSLELCEKVKNVINPDVNITSDSHPTASERVAFIHSFVAQGDFPTYLYESLDYMTRLTQIVNERVFFLLDVFQRQNVR